MDLEAQSEGVLLQLLEKDGAVVPVGAQMAIVGDEGEDISSMLADSEPGAETASVGTGDGP